MAEVLFYLGGLRRGLRRDKCFPLVFLLSLGSIQLVNAGCRMFVSVDLIHIFIKRAMMRFCFFPVLHY